MSTPGAPTAAAVTSMEEGDGDDHSALVDVTPAERSGQG
jgi:hypothetical protein